MKNSPQMANTRDKITIAMNRGKIGVGIPIKMLIRRPELALENRPKVR
jgi:hypothetical protein